MSLEATINVAHWLPRSQANGPGTRFVLWTQGCPLACPGCWNPDTWSTESRTLMSVDEILALIDEATPIEGVTLSGGEPFAQSAVLVQLASAVRDRGLSRMAFTGYELCELTSPDQQALLKLLDIVITGRFVAAQKRSDLLWRGSSNQVVHFLTDRYRQGDHEEAVAVEVALDGRGGARVTGFPPHSLLVQLRTGRAS